MQDTNLSTKIRPGAVFYFHNKSIHTQKHPVQIVEMLGFFTCTKTGNITRTEWLVKRLDCEHTFIAGSWELVAMQSEVLV